MSKIENSTNGWKTIFKDEIGNFPQNEIRTESANIKVQEWLKWET